jgi:1,2-diacylglycerol 3-beta-galactosyltransferase
MPMTAPERIHENDVLARRIQFIYFDAGGGHRAAATALRTAIQAQRRPWDIQLVNLQQVLDPLDIFRKITGIRLQDLYNLMLAKGWTLGSAQLLRLMHGVIAVYHSSTVRLLERHWRETSPEMVVSLVPNFNRAMRESLRAVNSATPYVTILTDFADYPPHFWIERQDQFLICPTERAVEQARQMGYRAGQVFKVSGVILRPQFYEPIQVDRASERRRLGLQPDAPTALVLFGGQGSSAMLDIAKRLGNSDLGLQLILICGRNAKLASRLRSLKTKAPMFVEGFTTEIPYYMRLADFFIGKPGPGSISEALAMKLPVLIERNAWTLPQERFNAEWVRQKQVGIVVGSFRRVVEAAGQLLAPENLQRFRANASCIENRAVFEIPEILAGLLQ